MNILTYAKRVGEIFVGVIILFVLYNHLGEWFELGVFSSPSRSAKVVIRNASQAWADHAASLDQSAIDPTTDSIEALTSKLELTGTHGHQAEVAKAKGYANADGTRLRSEPQLSVEANKTWWHDTYLDKSDTVIFAGDIVCAESLSGNNMLRVVDPTTNTEKRIAFDARGGRVKPEDVDGFKPFVEGFPMFALLVRLDNDNHKIFGFSGECVPSPYDGHKLQIAINGPYLDVHTNLPAPPGNNWGGGSITRIFHPSNSASVATHLAPAVTAKPAA